jgi:hypothetical protein
MPSIGQTWVLASIGAVVEMGILSTLKRLLMESTCGYVLLSLTVAFLNNFFYRKWTVLKSRRRNLLYRKLSYILKVFMDDR